MVIIEEENLGEEIGKITHYFDHISVAVVKLTGSLKVGDTIHIKGHLTDFQQKVDSMQIEHESMKEANPGDAIGLKVKEKVHEHNKVYKA